MVLKYSNGTCGTIKYHGREVVVYVYISEEDFINEVNQLGRYLDKDSIAWIAKGMLVYGDELVGTTTPAGNITWTEPVKVNYLKKERGKRRETPIVEEAKEFGDFEVDTASLWSGVDGFDWSSVMLA